MNAQEIVDKWGNEISPAERKEVYEVLLGIEEFGRYLEMLKAWQVQAWREAMYSDGLEQKSRLLGSAETVDHLVNDINEVMKGKVRGMQP